MKILCNILNLLLKNQLLNYQLNNEKTTSSQILGIYYRIYIEKIFKYYLLKQLQRIYKSYEFIDYIRSQIIQFDKHQT